MNSGRPVGPTEAEVAVLEALAAEGELLAATEVPGGRRFAAKIRRVDPARRYLLVVADGDDDLASRASEAERLAFALDTGEWHVDFAAAGPVPVPDEGPTALRLRFPDAVTIRRQRMFARADLSEGDLRCLVPRGARPPLVAGVSDISEGGVGLRFAAIVTGIEPGMVLRGCRIERSGSQPFEADLEVRHTAVDTLPGGLRFLRAGCRFVVAPPAAIALARELVGHVAGGGSSTGRHSGFRPPAVGENPR